MNEDEKEKGYEFRINEFLTLKLENDETLMHSKSNCKKLSAVSSELS
ncbi:hypothetical protein LCGC14_0658490 [marine sediment metagenome]|uniref:Uncharacterized protein n=1 Tax=marine sediment metagenome TaxID=412755 RepID=A0A0F9TFU4_9ZZZZ